MTPEQIERHRKRFEELEIKNGNSIDRYDDCQWYWRAAQNNRWLGYLLCAENQEVNIPSPCKNLGSGYDYGYNTALGHVSSMLKTQGIKVKP